MLTDAQRAALAARLRQGRQVLAAIPRRPAGLTGLPMSYGQEQLWFLDQFAPGLATYNIPLAISVSGPLDAAALGRALDGLAARHEALRTRLLPGPDGRPVQVIDPSASSPLELTDLSGPDAARCRERLAAFIGRAAEQPFDLARGPLLRTWLLRLAADEHILLLVVHHAVFDGWSAGVAVADLAALYLAEVTGEPSGLAELPVQFADYAIWERDRLAGERLAELERYWRTALAGAATVQFPADRPRPALDSFAGQIAERLAGRELLDGLRELSTAAGTTLPALLLAALHVLLYRHTGQADLTIGTFSANRGRPELVRMIGFLVNTLPVRADLSGDPPFTSLLHQVRDTLVAGYEHQDLPFGRLVETLNVPRDPSRAPLVQIVASYAERDPVPVTAAGAVFTLTDLVVGVNAAKFDLSLLMEARPAGLWLECTYKPGLYDAATITRLLASFETLLTGIVSRPDARLSRLPVLTGAELHQELARGAGPADQAPPGCLHELFEAQVARTPDAVAAEFEGECWTYAELNRAANQVGRLLRGAGAGPEMLTGICMTAGLPRLAAMLGAWKAGAGYVPLDPELPPARLEFMIADTRMPVLLADAASVAALPAVAGVTVLSLDAERAALAALPGGNLPGTGVTAANTAYVLYTSGSTGQPKGVLMEHRQPVSFLHGMMTRWDIGPADVVLQFSAFTFDISIMDTYLPLLAGGRVLLASRQTLHSPPRLAALISGRGVTVACLTPPVLSLLAGERLDGLRLLLSVGEELPSALVRPWLRPGLRFVNDYGPTEACIGALYMPLDESIGLPPPIGTPKPGYRAYVLDDYGGIVPPGAPGELHLGGAGVARGYLGRPALTAQRFVADPFAPRPGGRLYRTGDLVRRRGDGRLVFLGRIDGQVKIRGLRIELGEIEAALAAHPAVAQAVVVVRTDQAGERQLAGYVRRESGAPQPGDAALREHLARTLPAYMIPASLTEVAEFPLNPSGKISKSALPAPAVSRPGAAAAPPGTLLETVLASWYAMLLRRELVGADDGFFDLGGTSLQAMRLVALLSDELDVDIAVAAVFLAPTPRQLAATLRTEHNLHDTELSAAELAGLSGPVAAEGAA
jgi:amino acid adenylation domain-containing protein